MEDSIWREDKHMGQYQTQANLPQEQSQIPAFQFKLHIQLKYHHATPNQNCFLWKIFFPTKLRVYERLNTSSSNFLSYHKAGHKCMITNKGSI